jgi:hypothetical protein
MSKIANNAPVGNGRFRQGVFKPENPHKCINSVAPEKFGKLIYRSSWELRMARWCDTNANVINWGMECIIIPYTSRVSIAEGGRSERRYFIDFYVELKQIDGSIKKLCIEVKPKDQTSPPKEPKKKTTKAMQNYQDRMRSYIINEDKWKTAIQFCKNNGMEFKIMTEDQIF